MYNYLYTTYISIDFAYYEIYRAKVGEGVEREEGLLLLNKSDYKLEVCGDTRQNYL